MTAFRGAFDAPQVFARVCLCGALALTAAARPAFADEPNPEPALAPVTLQTQTQASPATSVNLTVGTLGVGASIDRAFGNGIFDARALTGFFSTSFNGSQAGVAYHGTVKLSNVLLVGDIHPGAGAFRIGAGLSLGGTQARANGAPQIGGGFVVNGSSYGASQLSALDARVRLNAAPVVLLGFGGGRSRGRLGFTFDIGAIFENPTTSVTPTYGAVPNGIGDPTTPQGAQFQRDLATFRSDLAHAASYLRTYPVLNLGLQMRF